MSAFETLSNVSESLVGTAPAVFVASTADSIGTVTAAGYLNDQCVGSGNSYPALKPGDIIHLYYGDGGSAGWTTGYVAFSSPNYNFVQGVQGVVPGLLLIKKAVNNYALAGGAAAQTITDAAILSTDIVTVITQATTTSGAYQLHTVAGAGSAVVTFNADPGASTVDYFLIATV